MEVKCSECTTMLNRKQSQIKRAKNSFCNKECSNKFKTGKPNIKIALALRGRCSPNKGKKLSDEAKKELIKKRKPVSWETRQKMSLSAKKRIGDRNPFYGKHHTEETKRKISLANKGRKTGKAWNSGNSNYIKKSLPRVTINGIRMIQSHYVWLKNNIGKSIPNGYVIHHIDENPYNNHISNLLFMENIKHKKLHIKLLKRKLNKLN